MTSLFFLSCATKKVETASRLPASLGNPMDMEVDSFMEEVENEESAKY